MRLRALVTGVVGLALAGLVPFESAEAARLLVFNSTRYVDSNQGPGYPEGSQESDNVQAALRALGHTVTPIAGPDDPDGNCSSEYPFGLPPGFTPTNPPKQPGTLLATAAQYSAALANADVFLIPEQESWCLLANAVTPDIVTVWRNYVGGGGSLIIHSSEEAKQKVAYLLTTVFGFEIGAVNGNGVATTRTAAAGGTRFASAPVRLEGTVPGTPAPSPLTSVGLVPIASLPPGSTSVYDNGTNASVAIMRFGSGRIIFLGWDWTKSDPPFVGNGVNGGWFPVLGAAVNEATTASVAGMLVTGPATGGAPEVRVFSAMTGTIASTAMAYHSAFDGGVFVAVGNLDGTGDSEIVTGAGRGGGPHVRTLRANGTSFGVEFFAYHPDFRGGVRVASCDVDGDGHDEIVTAPGPGGGPHVRVWKVTGTSVTEIAGFFAYDPAFTDGVFVGCGDLDGDGRGEVVTGADTGGGPHVRAWHVAGGSVSELLGFFAYTPAFTGGVRVAVADVDADGRAEIITSPGPGGGPHVRVWKVSGGSASELLGFFAYHPGFTGGVYVAGGQLDGQGGAEIVTGAGLGGGPHVRVFTPTLNEIGSFFAYDPGFGGGVTVAVER